jgi:hypothetical protein
MNRVLAHSLLRRVERARDGLYDLAEVDDINEASNEVQAIYLRLDEAADMLKVIS